MTALRLVFMGTPDFAVPSLRAVIEAGHDVVCAYTQPPRAAGRGHKERPTAVHEVADAHGIDVRTPKSLKGADEQAAFAALGADVAVVAAYGLILPKPILEAPRLGCVNVHGSLLPRWRGAAPIQRAILAGDTRSGITIMQMDEGLDTGPMLLRRAVPITAATTAGDLHDRLAELGAVLIVEALAGLADGTLMPKRQPNRNVTYAAKIDRAEAHLDWSRAARDLGRQVRAFSPYPGAWFEIGGERIRVLTAKALGGRSKHPPGTVIDDKPTVACGAGMLRLDKVQRAGKSAMEAAAFLRGFALPPGTVLGTARAA